MRIIKTCWNDVICFVLSIEAFIRGTVAGLKWSIRGSRSGWTFMETATEIDHEIDEVKSYMIKKFYRLCM